jgi:hypothetical protein
MMSLLASISPSNKMPSFRATDLLLSCLLLGHSESQGLQATFWPIPKLSTLQMVLSAYCWFLVCLSLQPWRWRQCIHLKFQWASTGLQSYILNSTFQNICSLFIWCSNRNLSTSSKTGHCTKHWHTRWNVNLNQNYNFDMKKFSI